mgnify:CR=1 FL=1
MRRAPWVDGVSRGKGLGYLGRVTFFRNGSAMHDIRAIRENPAAFDAGLALRNLPPVSGEILSLDGQRRAAIMQAESDQAEQNKASKEAGAAKARGDNAEFERLREFVAQRKQSVADLTRQAAELDGKLRELLLGIPNLPLESVPPGKDLPFKPGEP